MNKVISNEKVSDGIFKMKIEGPIPYALQTPVPGQFIQVKVNDTGHILPRPISICDIDGNIITIAYQLKGFGTNYMSRLKSGDFIEISGPFGHGFNTCLAKENAIIVGGGIGIAPLPFLQKSLKANTKLFLGFRNEPYLLDMFQGVLNDNIFVTTGNEFITDLLDKYLESKKTDIFDVIYACGPKPMLKITKDIALKYNIPCQISMEEKMCCGMGACLVCSCRVKDKNDKDGWKYKRVCYDGPVFMSDELIFEI